MDPEIFEELVGQVFEKRYRIIEPLGEGGMGAVFRAEHVVIGRQVAIKVLHSRLGKSKDFASRFEREAMAAGRLDHPNCVPVTDSGQLEDGTAYMVMELVKGRSLGKLLDDEGPQLDPVRALRITRHVLRGLGHAHDAGIVHRDIKPDNVMLSQREDNPDFARVLDFGIAKLRDADNKESEALTQAGMAVGTPSYLSPEQAMGDNVDHRSDLYSATVLLFEMLTGKPPFTAANPVGILTKHASAPVPQLWDIAPHLGDYPQLDVIVQRGLEKSRHDRFANAAEFVKAIDEALVNLGSQLTPLPPVDITANLSPTQGSGVRKLTGPGRELMGPGREPASPTAGTALAIPYTVEHTAITAPKSDARGAKSRTRNGLIVAVILATLGGVAIYSTRSKNLAGSSAMERRHLVETYLLQLNEGETCADRLKAVKALRELGDKRAIPDLKRARRRMRGGTLGFNKKNTNRCLRQTAQKAIKALENR